MAPQSARDRYEMRNLLLGLNIVFLMCLSEAAGRRIGRNDTCPVLDRCSCQRRGHGLNVRCRNTVADDKLASDMAKLRGIYLVKMYFENTRITQLRSSWFTNQTISKLHIFDCSLRDVTEADVCCINKLIYLRLEGNALGSVPIGLSAAKALHILMLRRNHINNLRGQLDLPQLIRLDLSYNGIETIDEECFSSLPRLRFLVLSHNNVHKLLPKLFRKAISLVELKLNDNRISSVGGELKKASVSSLSRCCLWHEGIVAFRKKGVQPHFQQCSAREHGLLPTAKALVLQVKRTRTSPSHQRMYCRVIVLSDLSNNSIANLSDSYFARYSILESINLGMNKLTTISRIFNETRWIKFIRLPFNRIVDISRAFSGLTELRELYLKGNMISSIPDGTFQDNIRLLHIDLASNNIGWIGRNAFKGLLTLTVVRLQRNQLISLNGSASNLPELKYLGASYNNILRLENGEFGNNGALTAISLEVNSITDVNGAFIGATGLRSLNLADNQVELLRRRDFAQDITGSTVVTADNNPFICDCRLAWLMQEDGDIRVRGMAACAKPWWLKGKHLRVLEQADFFTWKDGCEPGCQCECNEGSMGEREISVNCSSATVGRIPMLMPEGSTRLDLSANHLLHLYENVKKAAPHLRVLSLKDNALSSINVNSIPEKVSYLDLRANRLKRLPFLLVTELNLTSIWLSGNHYTCDCDDYSFRKWILAHENVVQDASDITCAESPNVLASGRKFITLGQHDLCPAMIPTGVVYLLLAFGLLAVLLALTATYLRYKRAIRAWLRNHDVCGLTWCDEEDDTDKLFDVFVSFSSKDIEWMHDEILPRLESMGLSYCTYERNFKGGYLLQDIIRDAVAYSRRTLLVLTRNFVESEWCRLEFRLAHQRALQDNINRLVIVLVEELEPGVLHEDLRLYVRTANYLRWGEPNFWDRLMHSLTTTESQRKLIVQGQRRPSQVTANAAGDIELR
ncbi:hypothetical protein HPB50_021214 [Hyalomma asiaticum]|uniref:Uncharacterized protein n=1 Tax=Hyalomma asiaticum TaxID=266040 RepID=A0ACB7RXZ0_HYAAI|nr:hypothetical protein HPB50_021214 [Hyalomma asiaticum]